MVGSRASATGQEVLREWLMRRRKRRSTGHLRLPNIQEKGPLPGSDLDDMAGLPDLPRRSSDSHGAAGKSVAKKIG